MIHAFICFAGGFLTACIGIGALHMRAVRKQKTALALLHDFVTHELTRLEAAISRGPVPK